MITNIDHAIEYLNSLKESGKGEGHTFLSVIFINEEDMLKIGRKVIANAENPCKPELDSEDVYNIFEIIDREFEGDFNDYIQATVEEYVENWLSADEYDPDEIK